MKLRENIQRIKEVMGLREQIDPSSMSTKKDNEEKDFSNSVIKDVVWRAGSLELRPSAGGIWFGETKEDVEKISKTFGGNSQGNPYYINLTNPYYYDDFWHGYAEDVHNSKMKGGKGKEEIFNRLLSKGYDGIIIGYDTWNDSGDENSVSSKQYVVFNPKNIKPANID